MVALDSYGSIQRLDEVTLSQVSTLLLSPVAPALLSGTWLQG